MIANSVFFDVPKIGAVCDVVDVCVVGFRDRSIHSAWINAIHIVIEEALEDLDAKAASKPGAMWNKGGIRLYIVDEAKY